MYCTEKPINPMNAMSKHFMLKHFQIENHNKELICNLVHYIHILGSSAHLYCIEYASSVKCMLCGLSTLCHFKHISFHVYFF